MSLNIDVDKVQAVLLPDGKSHEVGNTSFDLDAYEFVFVDGSETKPGRGKKGVLFTGGNEFVAAMGATWVERDSLGNEREVFCPMTAIQAVIYASINTKPKK